MIRWRYNITGRDNKLIYTSHYVYDSQDEAMEAATAYAKGRVPLDEVWTKTASPWVFAVVGRDSHDNFKYLAFCATYEQALDAQRHMIGAAWRRVEVLDAALQVVGKKRRLKW